MSSSLPATAISVVVQRSTANPQQLQIAVSAQIPRKRTSADDSICYKLQYWLFWDDKRNFSHLDSLLTRLAPLNVVHLACTERAEVSVVAVVAKTTTRELLDSNPYHCLCICIAPQEGCLRRRRTQGATGQGFAGKD
jgi:hypothetical protein